MRFRFIWGAVVLQIKLRSVLKIRFKKHAEIMDVKKPAFHVKHWFLI
jgi:hypothetical protein